ncbi:hypothetical protein [Deinococcus aquiradiocola]|uniref:Uncharacterized protein n=1 Tax=Deinococcus aquiradiocola TaxID=393059 RepID=A0A917PI30_9DEIO|nr:hypothetical protein [Deinococcus aquiradiocola]GGJ79886.1 hypothetical protein GCM10008939_24680 [Deinococcus aquiradiocola]
MTQDDRPAGPAAKDTTPGAAAAHERLYPETALIEAIRLTIEQHPVFGYYPPEARAAQQRALLENIRALTPAVIDRQDFLQDLIGEAKRIVASDRSGMITDVAKELGKRGVSSIVGRIGKRR